MKKILTYVKHQLIIALLYLLVAKVALLIPYTYLYTQPIWPVAGIAFAIIYFYGYVYLPALCIAAFIVAYSSGLPIDVAAAVGVGNTCEAIIGVWVLRKYLRSDEHLFDHIQSTTAFLLAITSATFTAAMIGTAALFFNQNITTDEIFTTLYLWFAGDFLGVLLVAPFLISWMEVPLTSLFTRRVWMEKTTAFIGLLVTTFFSLGIFRSYRYFIFMFLTWIAVRFSRRFVTLSTILVSVVAFSLLALKKFPSSGNIFQDLFFIQTFLGVTQINTLVLSSVISQKKHTEEELRESRVFLDEEVRRRTHKLRMSEQRFALALKNTNFIIFNQDRDLRYTWVHNPALGNQVTDQIGKTDEEIFGKKISQVLTPIKQRVLESGLAEHVEVKLGKEQSPQYFDLSIEPLVNELGEVDGITGVSIDVTERKQQDEKKDEFISIASHELKTPLTSIKGYIQILERKLHNTTDPELKKYLDRTNEYIQKLQRLISDLLDVSKIHAGKLAMNIEEVDVDEWVDEIVENIQETTSEIAIEVKGKTHAKIFGDRYRLEQVMTNLLTNAVKYSPHADKVLVTVSKKDNGIQISIQDFGMGIPSQELSKVFQRFYRIEKQTQHISGLGIGLYLSHEIVERHGGRMWVESNLKKGSTFSFWVPGKKRGK